MRRIRLVPAHGWPAFATEIIIVVIGVLIALGAQQLVSEWQWRREVADVRQAIDDEVGRNLAGYQLRLQQGDCIDRRLDQLQAWTGAQEGGPAARLQTPISRPLILNVGFSVWDMSGSAVSRMPLQDRLAYARLYSALRNYDQLRRDERAIWLELRDYESAHNLSAERLFELKGLITRAQSIDDTIRGNWSTLSDLVHELRIPPARDPILLRDLRALRSHQWVTDMCQPLRWQ